jgi:site-specific recombinase XerD
MAGCDGASSVRCEAAYHCADQHAEAPPIAENAVLGMLHRQAGIEGASALSGRRTFAVRLHNKGYDLLHIHELLGNKTLKATKNLIDADPVRLGAIVAGVI